MDIATLIGLVGAFTVVTAAILLGPAPGMFFNMPSILIVLGGSFFTVAMKFSIKQLPNAMKVAIKAFSVRLDRPEDLIDQVYELAKAAKKSGILSLENFEIQNPFLERGVMMLVDGYDPAVIRDILVKERDLTITRHQQGRKIFEAVTDVAPAMGMIGTLIGLVQMLTNMKDPKSIGPAMAVALLTTLYGAVIANMVSSPIADKLALRSDEEEKNYNLCIDAVMGIASGLNAKIIKDSLREYLPAHLKRQAEDINEAA
ncbi:MAG: flagellar motor protein PomA [Bdellovibrionales bacterium]|nr:flagellar motor protein PomA [Bdellovibrionales bacterium]